MRDTRNSRPAGQAVHYVVLGSILLLALFLRIAAITGSLVEDPVRGDSLSYFFYGVNLQSEQVYSRSIPPLFGGSRVIPDADVPPGYPLLVSALLKKDWQSGTADGAYSSITRIIYAQAGLSSLVVVLVYCIGLQVSSRGGALGVALLAAISPHLVNINIYLLTEPLFTLMFWTAMLFLLHRRDSFSPRRLALAGLFLALAALVRPTTQYLPFLLAAVGIAGTPALWRRWTLFLAVFTLPMLAWGLRNLASVGAFSNPLAMVAAVQTGMYPDFMYNNIPESRGMPYNFDPVLTSPRSLSLALSVLAERFMEAPGTYLHWYLIGKPLALFHWHIMPIGADDQELLLSGDIYVFPTVLTPYGYNPLFIATYVASRILYLPLLLLAAAAAILAWVPALRPAWGSALTGMRLLSLTLVYVTGIHMVGSPFPRYAIPFQPLLYLLAAGLLALIWRQWREHRTPGSGSGLS
ncbi:MAG TPA: hypothetical protein VF050_08735 [Moraxellaceae bacterium]